jgi:hypothetical protein
MRRPDSIFPPMCVPRGLLRVRGRRGQYESTTPEGTVAAAVPGAGGGRLRRPGAAPGEGRA